MPQFIFGQQVGVGQPGDLITSAATSRVNALLCDGSAYSRTTYAALFAAIGGQYGNGDGSTTFNVPDFRAKNIVGANNGLANNVGLVARDGNGNSLSSRTRGAVGGEENHTLSSTEIAVHSHPIVDPGHFHPDPGHTHPTDNPPVNPSAAGWASVNVQAGTNGVVPTNNNFAGGAMSITHSATTGIGSALAGINATVNAGGGAAHNNIQPYGVANVFIHT